MGHRKYCFYRSTKVLRMCKLLLCRRAGVSLTLEKLNFLTELGRKTGQLTWNLKYQSLMLVNI